MTDIRFIDCNDSRFELVKAIRVTVFTNEQGAVANEEFDALDATAAFALLYEDDEAVGTARLVKTEKGFKIGRIAIVRACRGKGYGALVVRAVCERAFDEGAENVYVDAQNYAVPFYERLGFKIIGEELVDRGLPHMPMMVTKGEYYGKEK